MADRPICTEEGVDAVLAHLRGWLLDPNPPRSASIPVLNGDDLFTITVRIDSIKSWAEIEARNFKDTMDWLDRRVD